MARPPIHICFRNCASCSQKRSIPESTALRPSPDGGLGVLAQVLVRKRCPYQTARTQHVENVSYFTVSSRKIEQSLNSQGVPLNVPPCCHYQLGLCMFRVFERRVCHYGVALAIF